MIALPARASIDEAYVWDPESRGGTRPFPVRATASMDADQV
ncbi:hypothetical protein ACFQVD_10205 [Streptosporangium amethystogenes subsp. fukuiense]|uniref:Transposase n=1 Tax=Streptosporangium amethystogenes subsp. fukuiense TaxID=698418 RepID=A0ABW2SWN6_9ACTN